MMRHRASGSGYPNPDYYGNGSAADGGGGGGGGGAPASGAPAGSPTHAGSSSGAYGGYGGYGGYSNAGGGNANYGGYGGGAGAGGGGYGYGYGGSSSNGGGGYQSSGGAYGGYSGGAGGGAGAGGYGASSPHAAPATSSTSSISSRRGSKSKKKAMMMNNSNLTGLIIVSLVVFLWAMSMTILWWKTSNQHAQLFKILDVSDSGEIATLIDGLKDEIQYQKDASQNKKKEMEKDKAAKVVQLEKENKDLAKERDALRVRYEGQHRQEERTRLKLREEGLKKQVLTLQQATRKESRRTVLERFGPGPHKVEFTVVIGDDPTPQKFVIELAPLSVVPHAIHLFLEQVQHGLWSNDYSFAYLNGPHVLQFGPQVWDDDLDDIHEDRGAAIQPFMEAELNQLTFPDYSEDFPHAPWTIGFTGRPGGPDFYINKVDNTQSHGPGGQYQHAIEEQGDACFGMITEGRDVLSKIFVQEIFNDRTEWHYFLRYPTKIVKAVILTNTGSTAQSATVETKEEIQAEETKQAAAADDQIKKINDKLNRRPRLPKLDHMAEA